MSQCGEYGCNSEATTSCSDCGKSLCEFHSISDFGATVCSRCFASDKRRNRRYIASCGAVVLVDTFYHRDLVSIAVFTLFIAIIFTILWWIRKVR